MKNTSKSHSCQKYNHWTVFMITKVDFMALFVVLISSDEDDDATVLIMQPILFNIHFATIAYALFLMLEHNKHSYYVLLEQLEWCHLCTCWLRTLYEDRREQDIVIEIRVPNVNERKKQSTAHGHTNDVEAELGEVIQHNKRRGTVDTKTRTENQVIQNPTIQYEDPSRTEVAGLEL
eukprot:317528_1